MNDNQFSFTCDMWMCFSLTFRHRNPVFFTLPCVQPSAMSLHCSTILTKDPMKKLESQQKSHFVYWLKRLSWLLDHMHIGLF